MRKLIGCALLAVSLGGLVAGWCSQYGVAATAIVLAASLAMTGVIVAGVILLVDE